MYQKAFPFHAKRPAIIITGVGFSASLIAWEFPSQVLIPATAPFLLLYLLLLALGGYRLSSWRDEHLVYKSFFDWPLLTLELNDLISGSGWLDKFTRKAYRTDREIYLGEGFAWSQTHVQQLYNISLDQEFAEYYTAKLESIKAKNDMLEGKPSYHAVGISQERPVLFPKSRQNAHTLVEGTTRVGKTRVLENVASQQIIDLGSCVIVIDPKGDEKLIDLLYGVCHANGTPERFKLFSPVYDEESCSLNPLLNYDKASDVASRLVRMLPNVAAGDADGFSQFVLMQLIRVCEAFDYLGLPMQAHKIYHALGTSDGISELYSRVNTRLAKNETRRGKSVSEGIAQIVGHPSEHFQKMVITITPVLEILTSGSMERLICSESPDINLETCIRNKDVILFSLGSMVNKDRAEMLARLIFEDLVSTLGRVYAYTDEKMFTNIDLHADELGDYLTPAFVNMLNKGGGAGLRCFGYIQAEEDLVVALGSADAAMRAIANFNNRLWLRTLSPLAIQNLINDAPKTQIIMTQESLNRTMTLEDPDVVFKTPTSSRTTPQEVPIIDGPALKELPKGQGYFSSAGAWYKVRFPLVKEPKVSFIYDRGLKTKGV